jgi:hypothetical protein
MTTKEKRDRTWEVIHGIKKWVRVLDYDPWKDGATKDPAWRVKLFRTLIFPYREILWELKGEELTEYWEKALADGTIKEKNYRLWSGLQ